MQNLLMTIAELAAKLALKVHRRLECDDQSRYVAQHRHIEIASQLAPELVIAFQALSASFKQKYADIKSQHLPPRR